ncbi:MAG: dihydrofolate reductase [Spirochaetaceae bacterium]|jgi:dihydrofolate reductase|nr:dihydrofolate reductase [Spirochaetaceae bacterium]
MPVIIIAAAALNRVIGYRGALPWRLDEDLARFRALTSKNNACVIMGRTTWESIPPVAGTRLPGRTVFVLSSRPHRTDAFPRFFTTLETALDFARPRYDDIYLAGGERVYAAGIPHADTLLVTRVFQRPAGDRFFPDVLDSGAWVTVREEYRPCREQPEYCFLEYRPHSGIPKSEAHDSA